MDEQTQEIEAALVGHWSHLGRWPSGALVDERGVLRYETPIPHLPYNGVIRTAITGGDPDETISDVVESFQRREVPFIWWEHPSCTPEDLGSHLQRHGLTPVERVTGMSIDLDDWIGTEPPGRCPVRGSNGRGRMEAYEDLIVRYWELPRESQDMVASLNRFWGPGQPPRAPLGRLHRRPTRRQSPALARRTRGRRRRVRDERDAGGTRTRHRRRAHDDTPRTRKGPRLPSRRPPLIRESP